MRKVIVLLVGIMVMASGVAAAGDDTTCRNASMGIPVNAVVWG